MRRRTRAVVPPLRDMRDIEEHLDTHMILRLLPDDHPAHAAYRGGTETIALTHLVATTHPALARSLTEFVLEAHRRRLDRTHQNYG